MSHIWAGQTIFDHCIFPSFHIITSVYKIVAAFISVLIQAYVFPCLDVRKINQSTHAVTVEDNEYTAAKQTKIITTKNDTAQSMKRDITKIGVHVMIVIGLYPEKNTSKGCITCMDC